MTASISPAQVAYNVQLATSMGIPVSDVPALWSKHMDYCNANTPSTQVPEYGGNRWIAFCRKQVEFLAQRVALSEPDARRAEEASRARRLEEQAKAVADAAYAREAVSLRQWLQRLRHQEQDGEALVPHERLLAAAEPPTRDEDAAEWIVATLARARRHDGAPMPRDTGCPEPGCGLPVRIWEAANRRAYRAGRCSDHDMKPTREAQ